MKPKDAYWEITFAAEEVQIHENILYRIMLNVYYFHLSGLDAGISGIFERDISFKMQILNDKLYKLDKEF